MSKRTVTDLILTFLCLAFFFSCSRPYLADQMAFGIWAAEKDLWDEAIFRWKKVLVENPISVAAHNNLAVAYERKGMWEEARNEYELALKLAPQNSWVKSNYQNFKQNIESSEKKKKEEAAKDEKK